MNRDEVVPLLRTTKWSNGFRLDDVRSARQSYLGRVVVPKRVPWLISKIRNNMYTHARTHTRGDQKVSGLTR